MEKKEFSYHFFQEIDFFHRNSPWRFVNAGTCLPMQTQPVNRLCRSVVKTVSLGFLGTTMREEARMAEWKWHCKQLIITIYTLLWCNKFPMDWFWWQLAKLYCRVGGGVIMVGAGGVSVFMASSGIGKDQHNLPHHTRWNMPKLKG